MKRFVGFLFLFFCIIVAEVNAENIQKVRWWKVYFTSPGVKRAAAKGLENPERGLIRLVEGAKESFYGAFYELSSQKIAKALIKAYNSGVDIKLIIEKDNSNRKGIRMIRRAGIEVVTDNRRGLMHNKFAIIDGRITWTGSYNLTDNGAYRNNNNTIEIHSTKLANIYYDEFIEMFQYKIFGNRKEHKVFSRLSKKYYVKIGDININAYFSPDDNIERIILKRLKKAEKSIHFMAFSFTSDKIGEEIIRRFKNGVKVYGIFEKRGARSKFSEYIKMKIEGIPVKLDRNRYIMHHKVIIIDKRRIIAGSFNYSKSANKKNDENILIIDSEDISNEYLKEFDRLYK